VRDWPAEGVAAPRAVILAVHGYGDHAESAFGEVAAYWAASGVAVRAYDQRGFGANPDRGIWPGPDALIDDLAAIAARTAAEHPPQTPLIVLGHSMGGGIVLAALGEGRLPDAEGVVLAAPAIAGGDRVSPLSRAGAWALAAVAPDRRFTGDGLVSFQASDNLEALRRLAADPLYIGDPNAREILGLVRVMDRAAAAAPAAEAPSLVLIGEKDELVEPDDIRAVAERLPGPVELRSYPEGWHLLFRDLQKRRVWADVRDWTLALAAPEEA